VVVFGGPHTLGDLATAEQVRPPTITRIIAALEQAGLVAREPDPADGRAVLIRATPAGKQLLEEGRARRTTALARQLATLAPGELATLQQAVEILDRLLQGRE
jgi:DNA-binding MarR family transcriptional regulator